jgi:hypothetical protein
VLAIHVDATIIAAANASVTSQQTPIDGRFAASAVDSK